MTDDTIDDIALKVMAAAPWLQPMINDRQSVQGLVRLVLQKTFEVRDAEKAAQTLAVHDITEAYQ